MKNSLEEISSGTSIYATSKKYKVPESTLKSRFKFERRDQTGRKPLLEFETETRLANWIIENAAIGDPKTKEEVLTAAAELSNLDKTQTKKNLLSNGWLTRFLKRNPKVSFRTPQAVTRSSANGDIRRFFTNFHSWVTKENLLHCLDDPSRFLNSDETGFDLNPVSRRVLAGKGARNVYRVDASKPKQRISVMYTFGANGVSYKPQIFFRKSLSKIPEVLRALGKLFS